MQTSNTVASTRSLMSLHKLLSRSTRIKTGEKPQTADELMYIALHSEENRARIFDIPFPALIGTDIGYASTPTGLEYSLYSALRNIQLVDELWGRWRLSAGGRVLDFGCGAGRLLRFVCEFGENVDSQGCEVNPKAVSWLREAFPCPIHLIENLYDLSFLPEPVDLIYAWSIFTHFGEREHHAWLDALSKALVPGGLLIATFKAPDRIERLEKDEEYRKFSLVTPEHIPSLKQQATSGFAFFECYEHVRSNEHGIDAASFGQAYVSHDYIRRRWVEYGDVVDIVEAVPNWQDAVVLRKR